MQSHQLTVSRTAHYYTTGTPSPNTRHFIIALHGYGQLASKIIHKFEDLGNDYFVVAPEALSRFYWDDHRSYQIVGASWMTRLDRLHEIEDYCQYLQQIYDMYIAQLPKDVKIYILGFSQGGATMIRWLQCNTPKVDSLILWGAGFPEDLDYAPQLPYFNAKKIYCVFGDKDPLISQSQIELHQAFTKQQGLQYTTITFDGEHEIDRPTLQKILDDLLIVDC